MAKFCFCLPLRTGNQIYAYLITIVSLLATITLIAITYLTVAEIRNDMRKGDYSFLYDEDEYEEKLSRDEEILAASFAILIIEVCGGSFALMCLLLFIFGILYVIGVHKNNRCLIKSFFVYSIIYIIFSIAPMVIAIYAESYILAVIIGITSVLHAVALVGVFKLSKTVSNGHNYTQANTEPGVAYKA